VKLVLVRLEASQRGVEGRSGAGRTHLEVAALREGLAAAFQHAEEVFDVQVRPLVRSHVAALGEALTARLTGVRLLSSVASLMRLITSQHQPVGVEAAFAATRTLRLPCWEKV